MRVWLSGWAVLLLAGVAHAQDGGVYASGSGLVLGPPAAVFAQARPVAIDSLGRVIVQPLDLSLNPLGPRECWDGSGTTRFIAFPPTTLGNFETFFAGLGQTTFVTATWGGSAGQTLSFTRVSCDAPAVSAGSLIFASGATPQQTGANLEPLMSNGDPVYATAGGLIRISFAGASPTSSVLLSTAALDAALGDFARLDADGGVLSVEQQVQALAVDPADHLWGVVQRRIINGPSYQWIVEITPGGPVRMRRGPDPGLSTATELAYDANLDAMLLRGRVVPLAGPFTVETLGVIPRFGPDGLSARVPPWPSVFDPMLNNFRALDGLVGGAPDGVRAITRFGGFELRPLTFDAALADFDRDGLRRRDELLLGTSDFLSDSDGDGVDDGTEHRLGTSPTDAGSAPAQSDGGRRLVLAESLFSNSWTSLDAGVECVRPAGYSAGPALSVRVGGVAQCGFPGGQYRFVGADGLALSSFTGASVNPPALDPGLGHAWLMDATFAWSRLDLQSGVLDGVDAGAGILLERVMPLSGQTVIATEHLGQFTAEKLWRVGPQGAFAVIDPARVACPIVGGVPELAKCGELAFAGIKHFEVRGWDPTQALALLVVWTDHGTILYGIGEDRAVYLSELRASAEGLEPTFIASMGAQGWQLQLSSSTATANFLGARSLGLFFQPIDAPLNPIDVSDPLRVGNFFRHGFLTTQFESYLKEPLPVGAIACSAVGGVFGCDQDSNPFMQQFAPRAFTAELIPVGAGLDPGEVLFFAADSYGTGAASWRDTDGGYGPYLGGPGWRLWRFTPAGAALPWLDAAGFIAHLDGALRAKVAAAPLTSIDAIAAAPDGLHLCLAEPAAGRLWELTLDSVSREVSAVNLREPTEGVAACGWDETGALAILTRSPVVIRSPGKADLGVTGAQQPTALIRLPGRWAVVSAPSQPSHCVGDDGVVAATAGLRISAASPAFGGVAWLDSAGLGWLSTPDAFCAGKASERLGAAGGTNLWMDFYRSFTFRSVNSRRAAIAMRPDGVLLAGSNLLDVGGLGTNPQSVPRLLFAHFPSYVPLDAKQRMTEVDPFRAATPRAYQAARKPVEIASMALIPGAPVGTDFGHLNREPPIPPPNVGTGGGSGGGTGGAGGGAGGGGAPMNGCGCGASPGLELLALGLLLLARLGSVRRRKSEAPGEYLE